MREPDDSNTRSVAAQAARVLLEEVSQGASAQERRELRDELATLAGSLTRGVPGEEGEEASQIATMIERMLRILSEASERGKEALTTTQAASVLGVSRVHLTRLLKQGVLPFHKTGTHHRVFLHDVLASQAERERERAALRELEAMTEAFGGYEGDARG